MKSVWIINHYATGMAFSRGGRHYYFAKHLINFGYKVTIFCASTFHDTDNRIELNGKLYKKEIVEGIPFIFVKARNYYGNGLRRILNMLDFYRYVKQVAMEFNPPEIIIGSSVHPLACVAAIKLSKKFKCKNIVEIRDLWPESLIAYNMVQSRIILKLLYKGEKWIYRNSDSIIMTWEGGKKYITDKGWGNLVGIDKVFHVSNGVSLDDFDNNSIIHRIEEGKIDNKMYKTVVYTGSIRKVNNLGIILDAAKVIQMNGIKNIRILIYGSGNELELLKGRCIEEKIKIVIFKGKVEKKYIPNILKKSDVNLLHNTSSILDKYGQSQNKLFEYLASGKRIIQTYSTNYSIIQKYRCGICCSSQTPQDIADTIVSLVNNNKENLKMDESAREASYDFDYFKLTERLMEVINKTLFHQ